MTSVQITLQFNVKNHTATTAGSLKLLEVTPWFTTQLGHSSKH